MTDHDSELDSDHDSEHIHQVVVIGAGLGGLAVGIELLRDGVDDLVVLESADAVGGVWRENLYPNCACDVPAHLYSFSFAPNSEWSSNYAPQREILAYAQEVARRTGLVDKVRFGQRVASATWDDDRGVWVLATGSGRRVTARHVVSAMGQLNRPLVPELPGLETFAGPVVHTARWDPGLDITGRRVLVVGAAASAVQVVPYVVEHAAQTVSLVRTPPYVMPKPEEWYGEADKARFREHPELMARIRARLYDEWNDSAHAQSVMDETFLDTAERAWREHMESQVADPALRRVLTPRYRFGCRRPVVSNDYYPALADRRTTVVDSGAARFTPERVVTDDGREFPVDVVVLATGFLATDLLGHVAIRGTGGRLLSEQWHGTPTAYRGTLVPHFPNFYVMYGPNTQVSGSVLGILEAQARFVAGCLRLAGDSGRIEVGERAHHEFNRELGEALDRSVFVQGGCSSWYRVGGTGRVVVKWPGTLARFEQLLERPDPRHLVGLPQEATRELAQEVPEEVPEEVMA